jgi:internalin A
MAKDKAYREAERLVEIVKQSGDEVLDLSAIRLTELPESVRQLRSLQELLLDGNHLTKLPEWLGQLTGLKALAVSNNQLRKLPESLGQLTQLRELYLEGNDLTELPETLGQLTQLRELDLTNNNLETLPESLLQLRRLKDLYLHGNYKLGLSQDILGPTWDEVYTDAKSPDPRAILAFYFSQRKQSAKPLNEVKLLLVGHGRVGKTSLSKALRGLPHDAAEPETPGIERYPLKLVAGKSDITAHVWDFGGQEFLHQTHQFFFSERSIYVIVLTGRQGRPMQEAEYWLRLIRTYGAGSPVAIALNQIKSHPFTVDEHYLRENYPEVRAVMRTDCEPRFGINELRKRLGTLAGAMPSVREKIDPAWARVRSQLEEMKESFVTFAQYRDICATQGVTESENQEILATILDCLGIALNYRDDPRLRDTSVLKPRWLVDGIYTILRYLHKHETNGEMRLEDFPKALRSKKTYPPDMHRFLLALMEKFELCFPIEGDEEVYLVPGLLNANQPRELKRFTGGKAQKIQFRYEDVRPPGLLPRFIVRSHTLSVRQPRWLRGVVLARGKARALVRGDHEGRVTDVFIIGDDSGERVWLSEFILSEMRILNDRLPVRTFVESEAQPGAWTELELLREAARRNEETRAERLADGATVMVPVRQTLREVESPEASAPKDYPLPLFICYAHADERTVKQLIPSLKVLARRGYIAAWRDTDLVPGEDWDETIKERLAEAKIILFMVSREFLASDYITQHERPLAMKLMAEEKAVVVPVILSPCSHTEEDFARLENLPRKGKPVSSFNPRGEAWVLVEDGLKKAVEQARKLSNITLRDLRPMAAY